MEYPLSSLTAVNEGAMLDARFKLAEKILLAPGFFRAHTAHVRPEWTYADIALSLAEQFYESATKLGWIEPLELTDKLPPGDVAHVQRSARAQVSSQMHGQKVAQESQPVINMPKFAGMN